MTKKSFRTLIVYECLKRAAHRKSISAEELRAETAEILKGLSKLKVRKVLVMNHSDGALLPAEDDMSVSIMND